MNGLLGVARNRDRKRIPDPTEYDGLPPGEWVLRGGVRRFVATPAAELIDHGTERGYYQHRRRDVPQCDACKRAHADRIAEKANSKPRKEAVCGTTSGYKRHQRRGDKPCPECREANRVYNYERYYQRKAAA